MPKRGRQSNRSITSEENRAHEEEVSAQTQEELMKANKELQEKEALVEKQNGKIVAFEKTIVAMARSSIDEPTKKEEDGKLPVADIAKTIGILAELLNKETGDWQDSAGCIGATIGFLANKLEEENVARREEVKILQGKVDDLSKKAAECYMCKKERASVVVLPCRHLTMCPNCEEDTAKFTLLSGQEFCPICKVPIRERYQVSI